MYGKSKRKFLLTSRRNYERKKWPSKLLIKIPICYYNSVVPADVVVLDDVVDVVVPDDEPLTISISRAYCNVHVDDCMQLFNRIESSKLLPKDWSLKIEHDVAVVSRLMSYGRVDLTINSNCQWTFVINEIPICLPNGWILIQTNLLSMPRICCTQLKEPTLY